MELLPWMGMGAVAVLVVGWLVVCFQPAGPRRASVEWLAAAALYTALLCLFVSLVLRALEDDSRFVAYAFGFLVAFFGAGLAVSLSRMFSQLRGRTPSGSSSAT